MPGLLDLPWEIRNQIYEYCLIFDGAIIPHEKYHDPKLLKMALFRKHPHTLALLAVNRAIHSEAALLWYGKNTWGITHVKFYSFTWKDRIWKNRAKMFRNVVITFRFKASLAPNCCPFPYACESVEDFWDKKISTICQLPNLATVTLLVGNLSCRRGCCRSHMLETLLRRVAYFQDQWSVNPTFAGFRNEEEEAQAISILDPTRLRVEAHYEMEWAGTDLMGFRKKAKHDLVREKGYLFELLPKDDTGKIEQREKALNAVWM